MGFALRPVVSTGQVVPSEATQPFSSDQLEFTFVPDTSAIQRLGIRIADSAGNTSPVGGRAWLVSGADTLTTEITDGRLDPKRGLPLPRTPQGLKLIVISDDAERWDLAVLPPPTEHAEILLTKGQGELARLVESPDWEVAKVLLLD